MAMGSPGPATPGTDTLEAAAARLSDRSLSARQTGAAGEELAAVWLRTRGWRIVDRNWRSRYGELDIVALDPEGTLAFVEVKTRRSVRFGPPQCAVTHAKRTNLRRAGVQWLLDHRGLLHNGVRFDVLAVSVEAEGPRVEHLRGAF